MRSPSIIPADVLRLQGEVSDPGVSAWVAANAGSGKTHVLAQRVINLLLAGVAAGKNSLPHLHQGGCRQYGEARVRHARALDHARRRTRSMPPSAEQLEQPCRGARRALARRLFARALETPGGLKVQTIHAFCTQLLHQFPFEANVAARFTVLDETAQMQLLERVDACGVCSKAPPHPIARSAARSAPP